MRASGRTPSLHPGARTQIPGPLRGHAARHRGAHRVSTVGTELSLASIGVEVLDRPGLDSRQHDARFARCSGRSRTSTPKMSSRSRLGAPPGFQQAARMMLELQIGVLVGYLSRRVLGQYDIALLGESRSRPAASTSSSRTSARSSRAGRSARRLRRWIALHETTHAYEFELHPWVRDHLNGLLRRYLTPSARTCAASRTRTRMTTSSTGSWRPAARTSTRSSGDDAPTARSFARCRR